MVAGAHGHHIETSGAHLLERRAEPPGAREQAPPRAWLGRGSQRSANRGQPSRADRVGRSELTIAVQTTRKPTRTTGRLAGAAAVALGLLLGGCLTPSTSTPPRQVDLPEPPPQRAPAPTAAQREHERILASYNGAYQDPRLDAVVNRAVEKLVAASERPDQRYRVTILNSSAVNAFALPSGHLYITRGLIALANDTSELASVLSHEMAHVIASHASMREDRARQVALVGRVFDNFGAADPDMHALALAKSKIALATFSRSQELEADGIGVGIAARAGYDPFGAVRFLSSLERQAGLRPAGQGSGDARMPDFVSSHPATPERVRNAQINARQFSGPGSGDRDRKAYLAGIDGMLYGEDPSEGYVRGRRFLHPRLGFTFVAPDGFALDNTPQAILGIKDGGGQALRLDVVRVPAEQPLAAYLNSGWIENIDGSTVEELTIGGFPAATALARGEPWTFRLFAVRFGNDVYRFIFATKHVTPAADRAFRESVSTFRRMSAAEANSAKPLRIRIVQAGEADTVERLAARMATDRKEERFRILNGLGPTDRVRAGNQVKIVTE
ncbi:MAG: M48 family metalloprotease [Rhizobiales bacterium]|nr:M48 family metalloprotease [Hyphomicrobiales bacterium]